MDIFNKIGETLLSTGRGVSKKAKDVSGVAKLKLDLIDKQDQVKSLYQELGKNYYDNHKDDESQDQFYQFDQIRDINKQINEINERILDLRKVRKCPKCGNEVQATAEFCSFCGEKLSVFEEE
ncbi:MAG: zinc ribbon domain-containing protein [Lachnospiraceae bacterium]